MFKCEIKTDNAAFERDPGAEIVRILRLVEASIENGHTSAFLFDVNGNIVGAWELEA